MKISDTWSLNTEWEESIEEFAARMLQGCEPGIAETAIDTSQNVAKAFGRLLEHLVSHNLLTEATVIKLIDPSGRHDSPEQ